MTPKMIPNEPQTAKKCLPKCQEHIVSNNNLDKSNELDCVCIVKLKNTIVGNRCDS